MRIVCASAKYVRPIDSVSIQINKQQQQKLQAAKKKLKINRQISISLFQMLKTSAYMSFLWFLSYIFSLSLTLYSIVV